MNIYTYWVNKNNLKMPVYLELCMRTWMKAIPDVRITIINHDNIREFLPNSLLTSAFFTLPLAMQSDIVSVWILFSRGGIFIDADTIMTKNPFSSMTFSENKLYAFGYDNKKSIHLAVMCCKEKNNKVLASWVDKIIEKISVPLTSPVPWDLVGNAIINPLLNNNAYHDNYQILDAGQYGNILELALTDEDPYHRYMKYYFTPPCEPLDSILHRCVGGIISLHNSWTPDIYKKASIKEIVSSRESIMLSNILVNILK